jgi:hypothetical protein
MNDHRFLLCRPASGLFDIFSQIGAAINYARNHRRVVIIDTNPPGAGYFRDRFSNYFTSLNRNLILHIDNHIELLNRLPTIPPSVAGRIDRYIAVYDEARRGYVDDASGTPLALDFSRDYEQPLLIHHAGGRSQHFFMIPLANMRLSKPVRDEIVLRLARIGGPFNGIHIRATDYQTDYRRGLEELRQELVGKLFVATDNREALAYVREQCRNADIYSFAQLPQQPGRPLHRCPEPHLIWQTNLDAIADVIMLAHAKQLYYFSLMPNRSGVVISGYSHLARCLKERPELVSQLMHA